MAKWKKHVTAIDHAARTSEIPAEATEQLTKAQAKYPQSTTIKADRGPVSIAKTLYGKSPKDGK